MESTSQQQLEKRSVEIEQLHSLASILQTGLNKRVIALLLELLESGIHPESLADGKWPRITIQRKSK